MTIYDVRIALAHVDVRDSHRSKHPRPWVKIAQDYGSSEV